MEFLATAAVALAVKKVVDTLKMLIAGDWRGAATQLVAWAGGFVAAYVAANTPWAGGIEVGSQSLADLNVWSLLLVGLSIGSAASVTHDVVVALSRNGVPVDVDATAYRRDANLRASRRVADDLD